MLDNRLKSFLKMIRWSETLLAGDNGYNVIVGGELMATYNDHPRKSVYIEKLGIWSTAAGGYQIKESIYDFYKIQLGLNDFGYYAQDVIALQLIRECKSMSLIIGGEIKEAIIAVSSRWASLPGNNDDQHQQKFDDLLAVYNKSLVAFNLVSPIVTQ